MRRSLSGAAIIFGCVLMLLSAISGCKKNDTKSGIVGSVSVSGGTNDGVTVMLFDDPSRSFDTTTVWYTTARQPGVGFRYDAKAAFDYRLEDGPNGSMVGSATSDAAGNFNLTNQSEGAYILVAAKPGFGWTAPVNVSLNGPTLDVGELRFYADSTIHGITTGNMTLLADHHYVIPEYDLLRVEPGDTLYVQPGAVIRGGDGAEIRVYGSMIAEGTPDHWITFTSNIDNLLQNSDWEGITFQSLGGAPGVGRFAYARFEHCAKSIHSDAAAISIDHCNFASTGYYGPAIDVSSGKEIVTHCVFNYIPSAISAYANDSLRIEHNVIHSSVETALQITHVDGGSVFCNWFHNCGRNDTTLQAGVIYIDDTHHVSISHNNFDLSWYGFNMKSYVDSTVLIQYNRFYRINRVMDLNPTPGHAGPSFPLFNYNCMTLIDRTNIFINSCFYNNHSIDATNNYWGTTDPGSIQNMVHDHNDDPLCPIIFVTPFLLSCPADNGICPQ